MLRRLIFCLVLGPALSLRADEGAAHTTWKGPAGSWADTGHWSNGAPDAYKEATIGEESTVDIPAGVYLTGDLEIARRAGDHAHVKVNGGELILLQDSLFLGEYDGSSAELDLHTGAVHSAMDVFVGGATAGPGRANHATLRISGGSFVARNLTVGLGYGADCRVSIEGSQAAAVHVLDYLYIEATATPDRKPGRSTLAFTLDDHGVTPITIESHRDGLRIIQKEHSQCLLAVTLAAIPPREDITLVTSHRAVQGTFDGLPEGSTITAYFAGRSYRWSLTYRGGTSGHDVVLRNQSDYPADAPFTHVRSIPPTPHPLWLDHRLFADDVVTGTPAFAGAEGYGAYTHGGAGGRTIAVDNLNDSGPGSLRAALESTGPRQIVFRVGGTIALRSKMTIMEPFVTVDGAAAPSPGILLRRYGIEVRTHDVVLRHFRIRIGDEDVRLDDRRLNYASGDGEYALYFIEGACNCIADHLSLSWSTNKTLSTTKLCDRITIQWCMLSESLNFSHHGYASIAGGNRVTWHHNLFAHHQSRCVRFQGAVQADFRNNVIYDWGDTSAYGEFARLNYVGNYLKRGPSTTQQPPLFHSGDRVVAPASLFAADNILEDAPAVNKDNWRGLGYYYERDRVAARAEFPMATVKTDSAQIAYQRVLQDAGATLPVRDAVDTRVVHEVATRTGRIIEHVADVGGWPDFGTTTAKP